MSYEGGVTPSDVMLTSMHLNLVYMMYNNYLDRSINIRLFAGLAVAVRAYADLLLRGKMMLRRKR